MPKKLSGILATYRVSSSPAIASLHSGNPAPQVTSTAPQQKTKVITIQLARPFKPYETNPSALKRVLVDSQVAIDNPFDRFITRSATPPYKSDKKPFKSDKKSYKSKPTFKGKSDTSASNSDFPTLKFVQLSGTSRVNTALQSKRNSGTTNRPDQAVERPTESVLKPGQPTSDEQANKEPSKPFKSPKFPKSSKSPKSSKPSKSAPPKTAKLALDDQESQIPSEPVLPKVKQETTTGGANSSKTTTPHTAQNTNLESQLFKLVVKMDSLNAQSFGPDATSSSDMWQASPEQAPCQQSLLPPVSFTTSTLAQPSDQYFPNRPKLDHVQKYAEDPAMWAYREENALYPNKEIAPARKYFSYLEEVLASGARKYIMVILDSDNLWFNPLDMDRGFQGGGEVYERIHATISKHLWMAPASIDLRIRVFANLSALGTLLQDRSLCRKDRFKDFVSVGIVQMNKHNYVVDVGKGNQAADIRVKAALADAILDPDCYRVFLGGLYDFGYANELKTIHEMGLIDKVSLIQAPGFSPVYRDYLHKEISTFGNLFENSNEWMEIGDYKLNSSDSSLKINKSIPCVFHHLSAKGCSSMKCTYSHEPITDTERQKLKAYYKDRWCPSLFRGEPCPNGDKCFFRH